MIVSDRYLLNLLREIVSIRADGHCEYPGCFETSCDPHHWYSKNNLSIRYDPDACLYLCAGHHTGSIWSAHRAPAGFQAKIIFNDVRSLGWVMQVEFKKNQIITIPVNDFRIEWKGRLFAVKEAARVEAERRGWKLNGTEWEKVEG